MNKWVVKAFVAWRAIIFLIAILAIFFIPLRLGYTEISANFKGRDLLNMWVNYDGLHYLDIARNGYGPNHPAGQAFFPFFPIVISFFANFLHDYIVSGLLVSHVALFIALVYLQKLIKLDYKDTIAKSTIITILLFPTSFFLASFYSESIFLLEAVMAFYYARKGRWLLASVSTACATATRITGIFLVPAIFIEFLIAHKNNLVLACKDKKIIWLFLSPLGLLFYMRYLYLTTSDPLYFVHIMPTYGIHRQMNHIILLYQVFYRYIKMIIFINHTDPLFLVVLLEFITGLLFTVLSVLAFKLQRLSYAFFVSASFLLPTLLGTFSSVPRYVIVLFPAFILLATWLNKQNKIVKSIYFVINIVISIIMISLFTRGYFIG